MVTTSTCSNMTEKSKFSRLTQEMVKRLDTSLISNDYINYDWPLLTLVKIKKGMFPFMKTKYTPLRETLSRVTKLSLESDTAPFVEDFKSERHRSVGMSVGGGYKDVTGEVGGGGDTVDKASKVTLWKEFIKEDELNKLIYEKIEVDQKCVDAFQLKAREKLAFVTQRFYNEEELYILSKDSLSGSAAMQLLKYLKGSAEIGKSAEISFTLPAKKAFAFKVQKVNLRGNILDFSCLIEMEQECMAGMRHVPPLGIDWEGRGRVLKALGTRSDLLPKLSEFLEDRVALDLLEDALDQITDGESLHPSHGSVASFLDLVDVSTASKDLLEALYLLVCALAALPEEVPPALAKCGLETLDCIMCIMDYLKQDQDDVPEDLLRPLLDQEGFLWVGTFLRSVVSEVRNQKWKREENEGPGPRGLLEALYISVRGVHIMRSKENA